jgi:hypothetical protein
MERKPLGEMHGDSVERKPLGEIHIDTHYGEKFMHDKPVYGILLQ